MNDNELPQNDSLSNPLETKKKWTFFWAAAVLLLLLNLGLDAISGSEGRWLEITREMLNTGDFLHPKINGEVYFDKPLLSYWMILPFAWINSCVVNEFVARFPSAVMAIASLWGVILLARKFWGEDTSYTSAWFMLTIYSFPFWGRLAEADMANMAFILLTVVWYFHFRDRARLGGYAGFALLCALGAQTKGLGAIAVPVMLAGIDMILGKRIKLHLNWKALLGALIGFAVYLLPFLLEIISRKAWASDGLSLVFRENIVRFFTPFDHNKDPFWIYFRYLPQLFLPWTPVLVLALIDACRRWKTSTQEDRWLLISIAAIFLIYSASGSRRLYYIMPILPFCAMLCGRYMQEELSGICRKLRDGLIRVYDFLIPVSAGLLLLVWILFNIMIAKQIRVDLLSILPPFYLRAIQFGLPAAGLGILGTWIGMVLRKKRQDLSWNAGTDSAPFGRVVLFLYAVLFLAFTLIIPVTDADPAFRTGRPFFRYIGAHLNIQYTPEQMAFYGKTSADATFYMKLPAPIRVIPRGDVKGLEDFLDRMEDQGGAVIGEVREFRALPEGLQERLNQIPDARQPLSRFEDFELKKISAARVLLMSQDQPSPAQEKQLNKLKKRETGIVGKKFLVKMISPTGETAD